jgi:membrane protease YdiL (CAAX protease family)
MGLRKSAVIIGLPLLVLALDWFGTGRDAASLGLAIPPSAAGQIGLGIASFIIGGVLLCTLFGWPQSSPENRAKALARLQDKGLVPQTRKELAYAVLQAFLIGCGSEILFRGFLVWAFAPFLGLWGAVVGSALAYGLGHGDKEWRRLLAATVSALAFTLCFALTSSLWWLMALHTFIGLQAAWIGYRSSAATTATP